MSEIFKEKDHKKYVKIFMSRSEEVKLKELEEILKKCKTSFKHQEISVLNISEDKTEILIGTI